MTKDVKKENGIWELPDNLLDQPSGGADFTQGSGPGQDFARNFHCFAQGIGDFNQGTKPNVSIK